MKFVLPMLALPLAFSSLVGCSNVADNSLLTDEANDASSHTVNKTPLSTEVSLSPDSSTWAMPTSSGATMQVEISGSCYTSTYASHYIRAYVGSTNSTVAMADLKNPGADALCRDGRFAFYIPATSVPVGTTEVRIELAVVDPKDGIVVNQANAVKRINVTRPN